MSSMENFLSEQAQQLELEKQRLCSEDAETSSIMDGLDAGHGGAGGDATDSELLTSRSNISVRSEKSQKDVLNHALSGGEAAEVDNNNSLASARRQRVM